MSDEIYEFINYVGSHESIAQFRFLKERVIIVNRLSKGYAMTGWRLGYIAAHPAIAKACEKIQGQTTSGQCRYQRAAIAALTGDSKPSAMMVEEFTKRRKRVMELLNGIPGIACSEPEGAFYVFPDVKVILVSRMAKERLPMPTISACTCSTRPMYPQLPVRPLGARLHTHLFANSMANIEKGLAYQRRRLPNSIEDGLTSRLTIYLLYLNETVRRTVRPRYSNNSSLFLGLRLSSHLESFSCFSSAGICRRG